MILHPYHFHLFCMRYTFINTITCVHMLLYECMVRKMTAQLSMSQ